MKKAMYIMMVVTLCCSAAATADENSVKDISDPRGKMKPWDKGAWETGTYRNVFLEAGYKQQEIDAKLAKAYYDLFEGPGRVYFEVGEDMAYVSDIKNHDARTEGLSYGMMVAVQLNKKEVFDRLWRWTVKYMQHQDGPREAYFAWSVDPKTGRQNSPGSASDGELYFVTALLFASNRWGNDTGIDYYAQARRILDAMWSKDGTGGIRNIINTEHKMITFVPEGRGYEWTDPSYHVPAFFEIWGEYAKDGHEAFYRECAEVSRQFLHKACHPETGLTPDYAEFDGTPHPGRMSAFGFDSWRVPMNIAMDYSWYARDKSWQQDYCRRIQDFLFSRGMDTFEDQFNVDGTTRENIMGAGGYRTLRHSLGWVSTTAAASIMGTQAKSWKFVDAIWNAKLEPYKDGYFDPYYDGFLYLFSLMHLSGNYQIIRSAPIEPSRTVAVQAEQPYRSWAKTPPMGWNSWDCFGTTLTEEQAKAQADAMEKYLKPYGWIYFTVDIQWYEPDSQGHGYRGGAPLQMDECSRLIPGLKKFPSSSDGRGFKPLADYIHSKGLKFGIHIMRGIPRQAVRDNTAILGTNVRAADIANTRSTCAWNPDMYGVDMSKPGAQDYYDSLFELYASWGVDFVKVDDISRPYDQVQRAEIEAIHRAIDKCGRPMVLSLSPGDTPIERGEHVMNHANMWRISDDFWDRWPPLYEMFERLNKWTPYRTEGAWPDADMLPFGIVEFNRPTRFTEDEQKLCMSLWCIARSPLILGADMTRMDDFTLNLLTNPEVLAVNQKSTNNRQISNEKGLIVWAADMPCSDDRYVALFNTQSNDDPFDLSKPDYQSRVIRGDPKSDLIDISVPIHNARRLVLLVSDGGDNSFYDHAAWIEPKVTGSQGTLKLADRDWGIATAGWGEVRKNRTVDDRPLTLNGNPVQGIGTHGISVVEFELPEGYETFSSKGMITEGSQGRGSVRFCVLIDPDKQMKPERSSISINFSVLGITGKALVRDLWEKQDIGVFSDEFGQELPLHGAGLFRISPRP